MLQTHICLPPILIFSRETYGAQCFSKYNIYENYLGISYKVDSGSVDLGFDQRFSISSKLLDEPIWPICRNTEIPGLGACTQNK
jgi:hypothetical protein